VESWGVAGRSGVVGAVGVGVERTGVAWLDVELERSEARERKGDDRRTGGG
jgi:hypothetical protein